jgi:copper chaperone
LKLYKPLGKSYNDFFSALSLFVVKLIDMEKAKFKTNIKCAACVAKVTPFLNEVAGENNWQVDLVDPARTLTVSENADSNKIAEALQKAGYKGEKV